jgi:hypothetical protein
MVAPATAVGREATVDRPTGQPEARAAAIPLLADLPDPLASVEAIDEA